MSKISNTNAYPIATPVADDLLIFTDVSDFNATKTTTISGISNGGLLTEEIIVSPEEMLSLNGGGEIKLIEAKGLNTVIVPTSFFMSLDFNTTPYNFVGATTSEDIRFTYGNALLPTDDAFFYIGNLFNESQDTYFVLGGGGTFFGTLNIKNQPLVIKALSSTTVTQGDSPVTFNITYRIVNIS